MKILGEWSHEDLRCTAMIMNGRYILKIESGLLEQTYKFRDGQFDSLESLKSKITSTFYMECRQAFVMMNSNQVSIFSSAEDDFSFPDII